MKYTLIRSNRKTLAIQVDRDGQLIVRAPYRFPLSEIEPILESNRSKIERAKKRAREIKKNEPSPLKPLEIAALYQKAEEILPEKVAHYSEIMGLNPSGITITAAKSRFGSCSSKGRICFSYRLMLYPDDCIDYVVVHELAHLRHMNHSKEFYALVESVMPDWKARQDRLRGKAASPQQKR